MKVLKVIVHLFSVVLLYQLAVTYYELFRIILKPKKRMKNQLLTKEQFESPENQNRDKAIVGYKPTPSQVFLARAIGLLEEALKDLNSVPNKVYCENYKTCSKIEAFLEQVKAEKL